MIRKNGKDKAGIQRRWQERRGKHKDWTRNSPLTIISYWSIHGYLPNKSTNLRGTTRHRLSPLVAQSQCSRIIKYRYNESATAQQTLKRYSSTNWKVKVYPNYHPPPPPPTHTPFPSPSEYAVRIILSLKWHFKEKSIAELLHDPTKPTSAILILAFKFHDC